MALNKLKIMLSFMREINDGNVPKAADYGITNKEYCNVIDACQDEGLIKGAMFDTGEQDNQILIAYLDNVKLTVKGMEYLQAEARDKEIYTYIGEFAKFKYEKEMQRENSIIQQAGYMQMAFSFITVALFMVAPILIEYRGTLSLNFFLIAFSSITIFLVVSLFLATMAQNRLKNDTFEDIDVMRDYIIENDESFETEAQRQKYLVDCFAKVQKSKVSINDRRVKRIRQSMYVFYGVLALCIFWFIVAICKII